MPFSKNLLAKAITLVLVLVLAAGVVVWLRSGDAPRSPQAAGVPGEEAVSAAQTTRAAGAPPVSAKPIAPAPLPSLQAPLALIVDDLKARSDAGDPDAACRLAAELLYCSHRNMQRASFDRWLAERQSALASITAPEMQREAAENIEREMTVREGVLDQLTRHCEGVPAGTPNNIALQWRRAALLGSPAAMRQYASGNAFRWGSLMDSLPLLATYRAEAEAMATGVARQGDAAMLMALASGYDPMPTQNRSLLAQSLRPDGARALAMYQRAQGALDRLPEGAMAPLRRQLAARTSALDSMLSPAERVRAQRLLEEGMASWAPPVLGEHFRNQAGGQADVHRLACGAPPGESVRRRPSQG